MGSLIGRLALVGTNASILGAEQDTTGSSVDFALVITNVLIVLATLALTFYTWKATKHDDSAETRDLIATLREHVQKEDELRAAIAKREGVES
jgi:multisubunit Na+/H+ antiporter MnhC subunit